MRPIRRLSRSSFRRRVGFALPILSPLLASIACYSSGPDPCDGGSCNTDGLDADHSDVSQDGVDWATDGRVDTDDAEMHETDASRCPDDMVFAVAAGVCIDRYEASRGRGDTAVSEVDMMPWAPADWYDAAAACERAGKRLCSVPEWQAACGGPEGRDTPYGAEFTPGLCNEAAAAGPLPAVLPTGSLGTCEGGYPGVFDMAGNVSEWSSEYHDASADGGAWAVLLGESAFHDGVFGGTCTLERREAFPGPGGSERDVGFRCCKAP